MLHFKQKTIGSIILLVLLVFHLSGCDDSFQPLQEDHNYVFSMYGTLDLNADSQWVRVMPIGKTLLPNNPEPENIEVTLTRESTGKITTLNDSLFVFGGDTYVQNYWTHQTIHPNETYTVKAHTQDVGVSTATTITPSVLPKPEITFTESEERVIVEGTSKDPIVMVKTQYRVQVLTDFGCTPEQIITFSHIDQLFQRETGVYRIIINNQGRLSAELGVSASEYIINSRDVIVISSRDGWPDYTELNEQEIVLPGSQSNVKNGTGIIAGSATQKIILTPRRPKCGG